MRPPKMRKRTPRVVKREYSLPRDLKNDNMGPKKPFKAKKSPCYVSVFWWSCGLSMF
jgi:hypothetical protein